MIIKKGERRFSRFEKDNLRNCYRTGKMLATYPSKIHWPRSVCCLADDDGSLIVCEEDQCRLILFTPRLMLRSTYGGKRGNHSDQFDSPWSVATTFDNSKSNILVADSNNRRIQFFTIGYSGQFRYQHTVTLNEKPYFLATSKQHFAVSCEKGLIYTFRSKGKLPVATIDLNQIFSTPSKS